MLLSYICRSSNDGGWHFWDTPCISWFPTYYICFDRLYFWVFYLGQPVSYWFYIKATNNHARAVDMVTTMRPPNNTFDITPGNIFRMTVRTNSPNSIIFRVYDKSNGFPVIINGKYSVRLSPTQSLQSGPQQLFIGGTFVKQSYRYCILIE